MRVSFAALVLSLPFGLLVGCGSGLATKVDFVAPPGSVLTLEKKDYPLPATIALSRPKDPGAITRDDVEIHVPAVKTDKGPQSLDAEGVLEIYGYNESDVDRLATNTCNLSDEELEKAIQGYAVIFEGSSPTQQKLYRLTIGKKRPAAEVK